MIRDSFRGGAALVGMAAAVAVAVAAGNGAFDATGSSAAATSSGAEAAASPTGGVSAPSAAQVAAFPVLGEPATSADEVATSPEALSALGEAQSQYGADPSLGRTVLVSSAGSAVVVPGEEAMCLLTISGAEDASTLCKPEPAAESDGLGVEEDVNDERFSVIGVFPASAGVSDLRAVSQDGTETAVELSAQDGYIVATDSKPAALRWTGADGAQHSRTLFWPQQP